MLPVAPTPQSPGAERNPNLEAAVAHSQGRLHPDQRLDPGWLSTRAGLLLVLILPVFAVAPLLYPGYIQTHTGLVPVWNIVDLQANLGDLSWVPHIAVQFDPLRSSGLLPYYLAGILPLTPAVAIKVIMGASWLLGGPGIFLWLRSWLGNPGALVAALVYTFLPHQIVTVYVRGAWGEALFWGLLPWAILACTYLVTSPKMALLPVAVMFWFGLGLSQLGLTLWALLFVMALLLVVHRAQALRPILSAVLGTIAAITIYFIVSPHHLFAPASTPFGNHFLYPYQLFSAHWGFGISRPGPIDDLSLQVGLAAIGLAGLGVYIWQRSESSQPSIGRTDRRLIFFLGGALSLTLLQFGLTAFLWNLPLAAGQSLSSTLTYPWQLLGLIGLCLSILAGAALRLDRQLRQLPIVAAIIVIIILSVYNRLLPQFIQLDPQHTIIPRAELGQAQLALLDYEFSVLMPGHTVGLERGQTDIPLALHGPLQGDNVLLLNITWQPLQPFSDNLKVFVHLVDSNENILVQFDGQPRAGLYPTSQWIPGEIIKDNYPLPFPAKAPSGPYRVFLGLYNETTLERLSVAADLAGRVILDVR